MKTLLTFSLLLVSLGAIAKPEYQSLSGGPEVALSADRDPKATPEASRLQDELVRLENTSKDATEAEKAAAAILAADVPAPVAQDQKSAQETVEKQTQASQEVVNQTKAPSTKPTVAPVTTVSLQRAAIQVKPTKPDAPTKLDLPKSSAKTTASKTDKAAKGKKASTDEGVIVMKPTVQGGLPDITNNPAAPQVENVQESPTSASTVAAPVEAYRMTNELKVAAPDAIPAAAKPASSISVPVQPAPVTPAAATKPAPSGPPMSVAVTPPVPVAPVPRPAAPVPVMAAAPAPLPTLVTHASPTPPAAQTKRAALETAKEIIPAGVLKFQAAPLEQVLDYYSDLVHRTLLRPAQLPAASITISTKNDLTTEEAVQALDSVLGLNGIAMIPVGEKFMKVVPQAQANQEAAALSTITNSADLPEIGQYITYVAQLRYAKPSEVATSLQPFQKAPNSVIALDSNGILIIRDFTENVKRMLEMIERIDVAIPSEFVSEVIPIKYALAADIQNALSSISGASSGGTSVGSTRGAGVTAGSSRLAGSGTSYQANQPGGMSRPPGSLGSATSPVSSGLGGGGAAGAASSFQDRLRNIIQKASASGADIQLIGPNKIIADERTNALLVFATREDMATIKDIISKLDVVLAQVLIEAVIMDVTLGNDFNFGISAGQRPTAIGGTNGSALGGNVGGQLQGALSFLNNLIQTTNGNFTGADIIPYGSDSGLSYFGRLNQSWDFAIKAIAGDNNIKVLARPRIQTSHAVPASIFVGETRPYITGTYYDGYSGGNSRSQYSQTQIGISLNVLPLINPEGLVVMDIQQQVQQVGGSVKIDNNEVPITQDQNSQTKVAVYNGDTVVLGGFIRDQKSETKSGVPYLKDIPLLGALFRSTGTTSGRRELLVLIRPTVLPTPQIAAMQTEIERNRLTSVRAAEEEFSSAQLKRMKKASNKKKADLEEEYRQAEAMEKVKSGK